MYDTDTFLARSAFVKKQIESCRSKTDALKEKLRIELGRKNNQDNFIPLCKNLIDNYDILNTVEKNAALKELIDHVNYTKLEKNKRGQGHIANFTLEIFPKIPKI